MGTKLALAVGLLVALAGVASTAVDGGDVSVMVMWALAAVVPAGIVALAGVPSGYSGRGGD